MAIRQQCSRIAVPYIEETAYGTVIAPITGVNKLFEPTEPALLEMNLDTMDDAALIKGHEFPVDSDLDVLIAQDVQVAFSFPSSLEVIGYLLAMALGNYVVAGVGDPYTHTCKTLDACTSDQLPSGTWVLGLIGDTASVHSIKGVCINELRITMENQSWLTVSGTAFSDGTLTDQAAFVWPTTSAAVNIINGTQSDFLTVNEGGSPEVSKKAKLRGFEIAINNNLDLADGRSNIANAGTTLDSLRFGDRKITFTVTVEGHIGDEFWADFEARQMKQVTINVIATAVTKELTVTSKNCRIVNAVPGFDGIRDTLTLTYKLYYNATDAAPCIFKVYNAVADYFV
jgi:hypothetical protein